MPRILLIIIFFLIAVRPINADVADEIKEYNKKGLPQVGSAMDASGLLITVTPDPTSGWNPFANLFKSDQEKIHGYSLAEDKKNDAIAITTFWSWLLSLIGIGQNPMDIGNDNAQKFVNDKYPLGKGREILSKIEQNKDLALGESPQVLGTQYSSYSDQAMEYALDCSYCVNMPLGTCNCAPATPTPTPTPSPLPDITGINVTGGVTPAIDLSQYQSEYPLPKGPAACRNKYGHDYIQSPASLPSICYEMPGINDYKTGSSAFSNGTCKYPTKGYCSPGCLKQFFGNDQIKAEKAAMICYKESKGNAYAVNKGCFSGVSNEYSVGLFQINIKNEDKNPFTGYPRSYQCWNAVESTGGISCTKGAKFDFCTTKFSYPEINIPEAWNLWFDREIYYTDICTVQNPGGVRWIWWGWSTAQAGPAPFYCDIKY